MSLDVVAARSQLFSNDVCNANFVASIMVEHLFAIWWVVVSSSIISSSTQLQEETCIEKPNCYVPGWNYVVMELCQKTICTVTLTPASHVVHRGVGSAPVSSEGTLLAGNINHSPGQMVPFVLCWRVAYVALQQRWTQSLENLNFSNDLKWRNSQHENCISEKL
jgi:hypothetical protein